MAKREAYIYNFYFDAKIRSALLKLRVKNQKIRQFDTKLRFALQKPLFWYLKIFIVAFIFSFSIETDWCSVRHFCTSE